MMTFMAISYVTSKIILIWYFIEISVFVLFIERVFVYIKSAEELIRIGFGHKIPIWE